MIVIGESGSGKTTFIKCFLDKMRKSSNINNNTSSTRENSDSNIKNNTNKNNNIFNTKLIEDVFFMSDEDDINRNDFASKLVFNSHTVQYTTTNNKNFEFKIIDSPGYGNSLNNKKWLVEIIDYVKKRVRLMIK